MSLSEQTLIGNVVNLQEAIAKDEGSVVLNMVKLGEVLCILRKEVQGRWVTVVRNLGYHERTASRYIKLARSWWGRRLAETGLATKLPPDLHKLEWFCRLSEEQLASVASLRLKEWSRGQVIAEVKSLLNLTDDEDEQVPSTAEKIRTDMERFIRRTLASLEDAPPELDEPERKQKLLDQLSAKFAKVELLLSEGGEEDQSSAAPEQAGNTTAADDDADPREELASSASDEEAANEEESASASGAVRLAR